jgi:2-polyprenyl-3-methyl-5-hydroxy-6-metoxy-1,4-benzoquinol methylase
MSVPQNMAKTSASRSGNETALNVYQPPAADFRSRVYENYVSAFKGRPSREELEADFCRRGRIFDSMLRPLIRQNRVEHLLDVACGQGCLLHWAQREGLRTVHGCDLSAQQVEVARELDLNVEQAAFRDYLPKFAGQCDMVVGQDIIEHLTRDEALEFLDLCRNALRPGGVLFLTTPNGDGLRPGSVQYGDLTHETIFSPGSITTALSLCGYGDEKVSEIPPPFTSLRSCVRRLLWSLVRIPPILLDYIETGNGGHQVLTRVMAVRAQRRD